MPFLLKNQDLIGKELSAGKSCLSCVKLIMAQWRHTER